MLLGGSGFEDAQICILRRIQTDENNTENEKIGFLNICKTENVNK